MPEQEAILKAVKEALDKGKGRKFSQRVELAVNLKDIDLSVPKNRIETDVPLPHGRGKVPKVGLFCSGEMATKVKGIADVVVTPDQIEALAKDKKKAKSIVDQTTFFLAEAPLMPTLGRTLGVVLGPRGKMPAPIPPGSDPTNQIKNLKNIVRVRSKDKPTFHIAVGAENQTAEALADNVRVVLERVVKSLERGEQNLRSVYVKTTMGPAVKIPLR